jgi:signal transduction histidine kinase
LTPSSIHPDPACRPFSEGLLVIDGERRIAFANEAARRFLTLPPGAGLTGAVFPFPLKAGEVCEVSFENNGMARVAELRAAPFSTLGESVHLVALRDVTDERLRHQTDRLESLGRFAGGVAHDLNNLLTVIVSSATFLSHGAVEDTSRKDAERILQAADRATALIAKLSLLTGRGQGSPARVDLRDVLGTLEAAIRAPFAAGIELKLNSGERPLPVRVDPAHLQQIIISLVDNAREAMGQGGTITIVAENHEAKDGSGRVRVRVSDTGCGMPPETLARAFDPFFSTKTQRKGTGLSLALAHAVMRDAGGTIAIESRVGRGTDVVLSFPRVTLCEVAAPAVPHKDAPSGGETILVVEDDEDVLPALVSVLAKNGYNVLSASDGVEGLEVAKQHNGSIDAVLSDVSMPRMNGYDLAKALRALDPATRILLMSGNPDGRGEMVLGKPFRPQELVARLRRVLDQPAPQAKA